jgi:hypothetical protein
VRTEKEIKGACKHMEIFRVRDISNKTEDDENMEPPRDFEVS